MPGNVTSILKTFKYWKIWFRIYIILWILLDRWETSNAWFLSCDFWWFKRGWLDLEIGIVIEIEIKIGIEIVIVIGIKRTVLDWIIIMIYFQKISHQ